jgi:hypothetical protein
MSLPFCTQGLPTDCLVRAAQTILFLAPLLFNQMLEEDRGVNRLEDSLGYWKEICSSELLQDCHLIVFFNKMDLLKATLDAGVSVKKYVTSYGDAPNDLPNVTKCAYANPFLNVTFCLDQWRDLWYANRFAICVDFKDRFKSYHVGLPLLLISPSHILPCYAHSSSVIGNAAANLVV